ncbi:MAG: hypothetical protein ABFD02_00005 [Bacteroidales bacterium]|jgi:hypothetical protein
MKSTLFILITLLLPFISFSQWNTEEPYQHLLNDVNRFCKEQNIVNPSVKFNYSVNQRMAQKYIDQNLVELEVVLKLIKKSQEEPANIRYYMKAVSSLSKIAKLFFHNCYEAEKEYFVFLYNNPFFQKLEEEDKFYIYYILGQCNLDKTLINSLLTQNNLPKIVKAKLNDKQTLSAIIDSFFSEYYDTINYDEPKGDLLIDLLYLNNKQAFSAINKILSSNHVVYKEIDSSSVNLKIKPWDVVSINYYLINEISSNYPYEIGFIKFLTYDLLKENDELKATKFFANTLEEYLTKKFDYQFSVYFKKNKIIDKSVYVPSPSLFKDEEYIRRFIYSIYGFDGELINITYDEARSQVLNNWKTYHNQN